MWMTFAAVWASRPAGLLRRRLSGWATPGNLLIALAASLLALDHHWSNLTWGGLALLAGVLLMRKP